MELFFGKVVLSSAGRDKGKLFVVLGADGRYVYVADGKKRKMCAPKKKNIRHIRSTLMSIPPIEVDDENICIKLKEFRNKVKIKAEDNGKDEEVRQSGGE